ncbi:uncharacterized protein At4g15545 isoform X2 [Lactuca sativa]|uniref:uncharacterized protein At4g15545 isoform X2 n=1 Tax=Lactuca sativa TaxID=4236 RepID=UPI000CD96ABB|nr:uncharacterized protein At4g15545 isoform X2 [Lactuca sativa]
MLPKESVGMTFDLPQEVLEVLPSDPFEQLDFARKITSIALFTRISALESESSVLRDELMDRELVIEDLQTQMDSLNSSLSDVLDRLSRADQEKENLLNENASLSEQVKKLNRDVAKLQSFRKTLMMSLQDEEGSSARNTPIVAPDNSSLSSQSFAGDEETETEPPSNASQFNEPVTDASSRAHISPGMFLVSQTSTPRLTPPGSPPSLSASGSPTRRQSISFSTTRSMSDDHRSSVFSSTTSTPYTSMTGRTRVDGKEFFRQVRGRLSYEQFGAFLANVKELNSHKQTKEDTLRKADDIFGPENKDLYAIFEGLISRNIH